MQAKWLTSPNLALFAKSLDPPALDSYFFKVFIQARPSVLKEKIHGRPR